MDDSDLRANLTYRKKTGCDHVYVTITNINGNFKDLFCNVGKAGSCTLAWAQALARIISKAIADYGMPPSEVFRQLSGIQCPKQIFFPREKRVLSCPDAIAQVIASYFGINNVVGEEDEGKSCQEPGG